MTLDTYKNSNPKSHNSCKIVFTLDINALNILKIHTKKFCDDLLPFIPAIIYCEHFISYMSHLLGVCFVLNHSLHLRKRINVKTKYINTFMNGINKQLSHCLGTSCREEANAVVK